MIQTKEYTSIPDTSDTNYWVLTSDNLKDRSRTFRPKDKVLHRALKIKQREGNALQTVHKMPVRRR